MALPYIKVDAGFQCIANNKSYMVAHDHPNYDILLEAVYEGDVDTFVANVSIENKVRKEYENTCVSVEDGVVYYDGEVVNNVLCDRIVSFAEEGAPVEGMINFLNNLMQNPSKRAVDELYGFLEHEGMPITDDGCFLAYKTVRSDYKDKYSGKFDNSPGSVLEMPRNKVDDDKDRHCSHGFHVGALDYAGPGGWYNSYGDRVVIVKVNPRDCVSVPTDHSRQKLRVCKYEVVADYEQDLPNVYAQN